MTVFSSLRVSTFETLRPERGREECLSLRCSLDSGFCWGRGGGSRFEGSKTSAHCQLSVANRESWTQQCLPHYLSMLLDSRVKCEDFNTWQSNRMKKISAPPDYFLRKEQKKNGFW